MRFSLRNNLGIQMGWVFAAIFCLGLAGCGYKYGLQKLEMKATLSDIERTYGRPVYYDYSKPNLIMAEWWLNPKDDWTYGCPFGPNCFGCERQWDQWNLFFDYNSRILLKADHKYRHDNLGVVPLYGISQDKCDSRCKDAVLDKCKELGRQKPPLIPYR